MRVLKFRGKVEGRWWYTTPDDDNWQQFWALVDKKTVGQFIGITDEQGTELYAGDILGYPKDKTRAVIEYYTGDHYRQATWVAHTVLYEGLHGTVENIANEWTYQYWDDDAWEDWIVVGNIHEHPEMLLIAPEQEGQP